MPKDISYADTTGRAPGGVLFRMRPATERGTRVRSVSEGPIPPRRPDREGPTMQLYLENRSFRPGDMVSEHPTLLVDLRDSSGINTSSTAIGHRIEAWVNNSTQSKDLTDAYTSKLDNFREGTVQYPLTGLAQGRNSIRVRAWDSYNNSSTAETFFEVASSDSLTITDVFQLSQSVCRCDGVYVPPQSERPLDVEVKVYTVAGRLIQSLRRLPAAIGWSASRGTAVTGTGMFSQTGCICTS